MSRTRAATVAIMATVVLAMLSLAIAPPGVPSVAARDEALDCSPPDKALLADLRTVAKEYGWTLEEAIRKDCRNQVVERVASQIREAEGEALVAVDLGSDLDEVPRLFIKGAASERVHRLVRESGIRIDIVEDHPYTRDELYERQLRVHEALMALGIEDMSTGTDVTGDGRIHVRVRLTPTTPSREELLAAIPADLRDDVALTITAEGDWDGDVGVLDPCASPAPPSAAASPTATGSSAPSLGPASPAPSVDPCASPGPGTSPGPSLSPSVPTAPTAEWGPMAVVHDPGREPSDQGSGPGYLDIGDECVALHVSDNESSHTISLIFRDGQARWDAATGSIGFRDLNGEWLVLKDRDHIILGGYDPRDADAPPPPPWVVQPPIELCQGEWVVTQVLRVAPSPIPDVPTAPTAEWGPMAMMHDPGRDSFEQAYPGYLSIGERCVVFGSGDWVRETLVFRDGQVRWDAEHRRIRFRHVTGGVAKWLELKDGDHLDLDGQGLTDPPLLPPPPPWLVLPAPDCPGEQWLVTGVTRVRD